MKSSAVLILVLGACFAGVGAFSSAPPSPPPVLVLGSTGKVGRLVVENLVAQKIPVRAFARNRTKASEVLSSPTGMGGLNPWEGVEVVVGDLTSEADLSAALEVGGVATPWCRPPFETSFRTTTATATTATVTTATATTATTRASATSLR